MENSVAVCMDESELIRMYAFDFKFSLYNICEKDKNCT